MKKPLLYLLFALTSVFANAQCVPDPQYNSAGVYPDSATNLPPACIDELYNVVITVVVPYDTCDTQGSFPAPFTNQCIRFDSVQVKNPNNANMNLPPNFSVTCDPPTCMFPGPGVPGQVVKKCMSIDGMATLDSVLVGDTFNLYVDVNAWLTGSVFGSPVQIETDQVGVDLDVDYYYIAIRATGQCGTGIATRTENTFSLKQNSPNPFTRSTRIEFTNNKSGNVTFKVYNLIGEMLFTEQISSKESSKNIIFFDGSHLPTGVYCYSLDNGEKTISSRMILGEN